MNIFVLDKDPTKAAKYMCDKHIVKMVLESAQLLSTVHRMYNNEDDRLYGITHLNHPCTRWLFQSKSNYEWLYTHFAALANEYTKRYQKDHSSYTRLKDVLAQAPDGLPDKGLTPFAQAMPDEYKHGDPVRAYRAYYKHGKKHLLTYNYTQKPRWLE